jgi:hypothetical protein
VLVAQIGPAEIGDSDGVDEMVVAVAAGVVEAGVVVDGDPEVDVDGVVDAGVVVLEVEVWPGWVVVPV